VCASSGIGFHRAALSCELRQEGKMADRFWRLAWLCWLRVLAFRAKEGRLGRLERHFFNHLLAIHQRYLNDFLSANAIDDARRHWDCVSGLVRATRETHPALAAEVADGVACFREDLATDYLMATRAMLKNGPVAQGWRADYENSLAYLRRLLSLDHDNIRLLTALLEICCDWFLDCYNNEDPEALWRQLDRFTPFALHLARLLAQSSEEPAARAALAEYYKYRAFATSDRTGRIAIYREAVRLNPENDNVRYLLAQLEKETKASPE
jgi:hypothetical protein